MLSAPVGLPSEGSLEGLDAITAADVRAHYARCARPRGAILAVAGYFDAKRVIDEVGQLFGDWADIAGPSIETGPSRSTGTHLPHEATQHKSRSPIRASRTPTPTTTPRGRP